MGFSGFGFGFELDGFGLSGLGASGGLLLDLRVGLEVLSRIGLAALGGSVCKGAKIGLSDCLFLGRLVGAGVLTTGLAVG